MTWKIPHVHACVIRTVHIQIQIKLGWALFVTYTIIQSIMRSEMCSLHLTHPSVHTWSSGQPTVQRPGSSRGLPVGDSNPQPWVTSGFKSNALSIRPTTACHGAGLPWTACHMSEKTAILSLCEAKIDQTQCAWPCYIWTVMFISAHHSLYYGGHNSKLLQLFLCGLQERKRANTDL